MRAAARTPCAVALVLCRCAAGACGTPATRASIALANGLRVIVKPDRRAPVVVVMVWYRAGSMDEVNGAHRASRTCSST